MPVDGGEKKKDDRAGTGGGRDDDGDDMEMLLAKVKQLTISRGYMKQRLTKQSKKIEREVWALSRQPGEPDHTDDPTQLGVYLELYEGQYSNAMDVQDDLVKTLAAVGVDERQLAEAAEAWDAIESAYVAMKAKAARCLKKIDDEAAAEREQRQEYRGEKPKRTWVKGVDLELFCPKDGDDWNAWLQEWMLAYGGQDDLTDGAKLSMLKKHLDPATAKKAIARYTNPDPRAYEKALAYLQNRYGGREDRIERFMEIVMCPPKIEKMDGTRLQAMSDDLIGAVSSLEEMGERLSPAAVFPVWEAALPMKVREAYIEEKFRGMNGIKTVQDFLVFLAEQAKLRCELEKCSYQKHRQKAEQAEAAKKSSATTAAAAATAQPPSYASKTASGSGPQQGGQGAQKSAAWNKSTAKQPQNQQNTTSAQSSSSGQGGKWGPENCPACGSTKHKAAKCPRFTKASPAERDEMIRKAGACLLCLTIGHTRTKGCPDDGKYTCDVCQRHHNTLVHKGTIPKAYVNSVTGQSNQDQQAGGSGTKSQ